jgi:hypothetical protein
VRESFKFMLNHIPEGNINGVEVGVYKGDNACDMLDNCDRLKLVLVDSYLPNDSWFTDECGLPFQEGATEEFVRQVIQRMSNYNGRAALMNMQSAFAAGKFPDKFFDYVYIDGGHDFKNIMIDLLSWHSKVRDGGIFAGHDYGYKEVGDAVYSYIYSQHYNLYVNDSDWWIINKRG